MFGQMRSAEPSWREALRTLPDNDLDLHICLWALYELHYRGFDDVDDHLEWQPS
ncbi:hypothetical protein [Aeromicrobium sp. UC242_57]|uniref:hypothetical protein n=1 Tax=Aeromicrobium sp. UC242_57 TaxID=3374624 RepID=UPI0037B7D932